MPLETALQQMNPLARQIEVGGFGRVVEVSQRRRDTVREIGSHPARISVLMHPPEASMTKAPDHGHVYRMSVRISMKTDEIPRGPRGLAAP